MRTYNPKRFIAALATVLLAACGGGSGSPFLATPGHFGAGSATFSVRIPAATTAQQLRPAYVSPNAATMQLRLTPSDPAGTSVQQTLDLNGSSCANTGGARTCTITVTLSVGQYSASVSLFAAGGALLSQAQNLPFTVSANQTTPVDLTLNGVPASFQVTAPSGLNGSIASGFSISSPVAISVQTVDASGATIVGPGSPSVAVTSSNSAFSITTGAPAATFTITPPAPGITDATTTITFAATIPGAAQPALSKQVSLKRHTPLLFVANAGRNSITGYLLPYTPNAGPAVTITDGVNTPVSLATDSSGDLFGAELSGNNLSEHAPPYDGSAVLFGDRDLGNGNNVVVAPFSVAVDKGGTVYAGSLFANYVLSYAPPISSNSIPATEFDLGFAPVALALNDSGNLAAANWEDGSIALFKAPFSSKVSPSALLKNQLNSDGIVSEPWHLAFDSSGTLWVEWVGNLGNALQSIRQRQFIRKKQGVSAFGSLLTGYTPPFTDGQLPSVVISAGMTQPEGLAINTVPGPYNGSVFVANFDTNSVTMYAPPITSASVGTPLPGSFGGPVALCLDAGGNLYVANATSNTITVYAPPYTDPTNPVATIANGIAAPFTLTVTP